MNNVGTSLFVIASFLNTILIVLFRFHFIDFKVQNVGAEKDAFTYLRAITRYGKIELGPFVPFNRREKHRDGCRCSESCLVLPFGLY